MDDFKIKFQGFTPSEFAQAYFNEVLQRLHEEAPANSFLKATISKVNGGFKSVVQINSHAGHFFATAHGSKITDLGHQMVWKMHRQLDRWKSQRRRHETFRDLEVMYEKRSS